MITFSLSFTFDRTWPVRAHHLAVLVVHRAGSVNRTHVRAPPSLWRLLFLLGSAFCLLRLRRYSSSNYSLSPDIQNIWT